VPKNELQDIDQLLTSINAKIKELFPELRYELMLRLKEVPVSIHFIIYGLTDSYSNSEDDLVLGYALDKHSILISIDSLRVFNDYLESLGYRADYLWRDHENQETTIRIIKPQLNITADGPLGSGID